MIDDKNDWKKYNEELTNLSKEIISFNRNNIFNYIESNYYNHIRDIVALSIINNKKSKIKILDYGSNSIAWANISNKINMSKVEITVFDPFCKDDYSKDLDFGFKISMINTINDIENNKFDLTIFGSSSQYIKDFYGTVINNESILSNSILFTHTPLSLGKEFVSSQSTAWVGEKTIRDYSELIDKLKEKGYKIIFKSNIPNQKNSMGQEYFKRTISANILFKKN